MGAIFMSLMDRADPNFLSSSDALEEKFEVIAFGNDYGRQSTVVHKWARAIRIRLAGDPDADLEDRVSLYVAWLRVLTGLDIAIATAFERTNVDIYFVPEIKFWPTIQRAGWTKESDRHFVYQAHCFGLPRGNHSGTTSALIGIRTDWKRPLIESCLLEKLVQSLGLPADTELLRPSIFSRSDSPRELSLNDKVLIRTLYDERITPGMARADAMRIARKVIAELVDDVKTDGEAALIHPRHLARGRR